MEVLSCYAGLYGGGSELIAEILSSVTTEQALDLLKGEGLLKKVVNKISERALFYINKRVDNKIKTNLIIYSNNHGILN
jgi:cobalt-precorrin-5B (C1)-methyltransferase